MKTESLFETKLKAFRKEYLEENEQLPDQKAIQKLKQLKKVNAEVLTQELKNKEQKLKNLKKQEQQAKQQEQQAKQNGSAL